VTRLAALTLLLTLALAGLAHAHHDRPKAKQRTPLAPGETAWHSSWENPVNRNLHRLARCETGYLEGGRPNWHHSNSTYAGALGFLHSTWTHYRLFVRPLPPVDAADATPAEQYAVARVLVKRFGFSSWPACSIRLGLR